MKGKSLTGKQADALWEDFLALCQKYQLKPDTVIKFAGVRKRSIDNGSA